jgi:hypothetical protein
LSCWLTGGIDIKDDEAAPQTARRCRQWFPMSTLRLCSAAQRGYKRLPGTDDPQQEDKRLKLDRWGRLLRPNSAMNAVSRMLDTLKKINQCPFSTDRIAYEQGKEIDGFIGARAAYARNGRGSSKRFKQTVRRKMLYYDHDREQTMEGLKGGLQEMCGPQCKSWVS